MKPSGRIVSIAAIFSALLFLTPFSARAQIRMAPGAHPFIRIPQVHLSPTHGVVAPRAHIATAVPRPVHPRAPVAADQFTNGFTGGSGESLQQLLDPVPGLGFDYEHLAAINKDLQIKAVIDPQTEWRLAVAERVARDTAGFSGSGYYLLDGGGEYIMPSSATPAPAEQPPQSRQPTVIVLQQQPAPQKAAEAAPPAAAPPSAPIPDLSNFTLVLSSGKKIQAVAFTRVRGQIVYITADGSRHSIPASELDSSATQQLNESAGTQFRL